MFSNRRTDHALSGHKLVAFLVSSGVCQSVRQLHLDVFSWSKLAQIFPGSSVMDGFAKHFVALKKLSIASSDNVGCAALGFTVAMSIPFASLRVFRCDGNLMGPLFIASIPQGMPELTMLLVDSFNDSIPRVVFANSFPQQSWGVSKAGVKRCIIDFVVQAAEKLPNLRVLSMCGLAPNNGNNGGGMYLLYSISFFIYLFIYL